jgi:hypothetical protein
VEASQTAVKMGDDRDTWQSIAITFIITTTILAALCIGLFGYIGCYICNDNNDIYSNNTINTDGESYFNLEARG